MVHGLQARVHCIGFQLVGSYVEARRALLFTPLAEGTQQLQIQQQVAGILLAVEPPQRREQHAYAGRGERGPVRAYELVGQGECRVPLRLHKRAHVALFEQRRADAQRVLRL